MKYKSDYDIFWSDGSIWKTQNGIVECPHELPESFIKIEDMKRAIPIDDEKEQLIIEANKLGLGSPSILSRNSVETLKQKIKDKK